MITGEKVIFLTLCKRKRETDKRAGGRKGEHDNDDTCVYPVTCDLCQVNTVFKWKYKKRCGNCIEKYNEQNMNKVTGDAV